MADRWNQGRPDIGSSFAVGFVSPWNEQVRNFSDYETIATMPTSSIPGTMAEQMDGDQNTTFSEGGRGKRGRKR